MMPSIKNAESIAFSKIKEFVAEVLAITRFVSQLREDYNPGTDDWENLCDLSTAADRLVLALPVEMLPDKEWRHVSPAEYAACDDILAILAESDSK
ncbi:hypothetical protein ACTVZO_16205 [Streptomyces sp. IBSNAI002]|uniref:hypothetical protein n=1 Tax=Streptomyces sp. IBSNAI002 TaxID=3457500 RepID=UPI003FD24422